MRKAEILGLPLSALRLDQGYLVVVQTADFARSEGIILPEPTTNKSRRRIVLPNYVEETLKTHLSKRAALSQSPPWNESGLALTTDIGTPINPHNMLKPVKAKTIEPGLPRITFRSPGHWVASILLENNSHQKLVGELLCHSNVNLTLNQNSHFINPMNTVVADTLDKILNR